MTLNSKHKSPWPVNTKTFEERKKLYINGIFFFMLFEQGAASFHFAPGPPSYTASPALQTYTEGL